MILNNYWNWKSFIEKNPMGNGGNANQDIGLLDLSGNHANFCYSSANNGYMSTHMGLIYNWAIKRSLSARIGSGDTAVQASDYALATDITSNFSNVSVTSSTSADGNSEKTITTISGTNTSGSSKTIKEVGITGIVYWNPNSDEQTILLVRQILNDPIEVANGQTFTVTITWEEA